MGFKSTLYARIGKAGKGRVKKMVKKCQETKDKVKINLKENLLQPEECALKICEDTKDITLYEVLHPSPIFYSFDQYFFPLFHQTKLNL